MESIIRHCFVMTTPKEFSNAGNEGNDVFLCEYAYDIHWHSFKRIGGIDNNEDDGEGADNDDDWNSCNESDSVSEKEIKYDDEKKNSPLLRACPTHPLAATRSGHQVELASRAGSTGARVGPNYPSSSQSFLQACKPVIRAELKKGTNIWTAEDRGQPREYQNMFDVTSRLIWKRRKQHFCLQRCPSLYLVGIKKRMR